MKNKVKKANFRIASVKQFISNDIAPRKQHPTVSVLRLLS